MITAAGSRPCVEMGSRRTQEESAVSAARAAIIAGFDSTSNLEAGLRYGLKTVGTAAHSFTLLHDTEREAFEAQIASMGAGTALLVDTYDVEAAVRTAVELAGDKLGAVRLDSGDLVAQAQWVRQLLDDLGNERTRIIVTSDLDEFAIAALQSAPVDSYGVGTSLVTGSGAPTASMVYKLVSRTDDDGDFVPWPRPPRTRPARAGASTRCASSTNAARPPRRSSASATARRTTATTGPLLQQFVKNGELLPGWTGPEGVLRARQRHADTMKELPAVVNRLQRGEAAIPTIYEEN